MLFDIRMSAGILARTADRFAGSVRKVAARYPDDPVALRLRVEADRFAGDREDRSAALAAWRTIEPGSPLVKFNDALLQQDQLVAAKSSDTRAWDAVRETLVTANKARRGDPQILYAYYDSFIAQGIMPTPGAQNTLHNALALMPQNEELRFALAQDYEKRGMANAAIETIRPVAYSDDEEKPQNQKAQASDERQRALYRLAGTPVHETPRRMLTRLEHKPAPQ
jgi:predicted Zn-dependent protease